MTFFSPPPPLIICPRGYILEKDVFFFFLDRSLRDGVRGLIPFFRSRGRTPIVGPRHVPGFCTGAV